MTSWALSTGTPSRYVSPVCDPLVAFPFVALQECGRFALAFFSVEKSMAVLILSHEVFA